MRFQKYLVGVRTLIDEMHCFFLLKDYVSARVGLHRPHLPFSQIPASSLSVRIDDETVWKVK